MDDVDTLRRKIEDVTKNDNSDGLIQLEELLKNKGKSIVPMRPLPMLESIPILDEDEDPDIDNDVPILLDVSALNMKEMVHGIKEELISIWSGRKQCERHQVYKKGGKERRGLQMYTGPFPEVAVYEITYELMKIFSKDARHFDYTLKVLLPEALTIILSQIKSLSYEDAYQMMQN